MNSLHRLGELWKNTFNNSPIGIAIASKSGKFVMANQSLCKLLGYSEEELADFRWQDLTHPEDLLQESGLLFDLVTGDRQGYKINKRYIKKDEAVCLVMSMVSAIYNPDGELQFLLNQVLDLTEISYLRALTKAKLTPDLKTDILLALRQNEFYLEYEPIRSLLSDRIVGHEALIRWKHPVKGLIPPLDWIPACEEDSLLMSQICSYVVKKGSIEARRRDTWISVNVSPVSLTHSSFFDLLADVAWVSDRPRIYLEITERVPFDSECLERLQALGYGVLLDDFGQGHSSLIQLIEMLNRLRSSHLKIKIDGWFSSKIDSDTTQLVMCEFVTILHSQGLQVIAECIETPEQLRVWQNLGVDYGQGWLWRKVKDLPE